MCSADTGVRRHGVERAEGDRSPTPGCGATRAGRRRSDREEWKIRLENEVRRMTQRDRVIAATGAYALAAASFLGIFIEDVRGRLLVAAVWLVPAVGWTLQYRRNRES